MQDVFARRLQTTPNSRQRKAQNMDFTEPIKALSGFVETLNANPFGAICLVILAALVVLLASFLRRGG